jgi:hypothetical protein
LDIAGAADRVITAREAAPVAFPRSDAASCVNGVNLIIDADFMLR